MKINVRSMFAQLSCISSFTLSVKQKKIVTVYDINITGRLSCVFVALVKMYVSVFYCLQRNNIINNFRPRELKFCIRKKRLSYVWFCAFEFVCASVCVWMCICLGVIVHFNVHV